MKNILYIYIFFPVLIFSQQEKNNSYFQVETFYGNILKHHPGVSHFLNGHPTGYILSYNIKSKGDKEWQNRYNYPDFGFSANFQDYKNPFLGKVYSIYSHYNFYLLPRNNKNQIIFRGAWGFAYATNPYDKVKNPKNSAMGSHLNLSSYFKIYYIRKNIFNNIGINSGLTFLHVSNASYKSPNTGINVFAATIGLNYNIAENNSGYPDKKPKEKYSEKIKYNFKLGFGVNETDYIGSGIRPFFTVSAIADKRFSKKSAIQLGTEWMVNYSL